MGFLCTHEGRMKEIRATAWQHFEGDLAMVTVGAVLELDAGPGPGPQQVALSLTRQEHSKGQAWEWRATEGAAMRLHMSHGYAGLKSALL